MSGFILEKRDRERKKRRGDIYTLPTMLPMRKTYAYTKATRTRDGEHTLHSGLSLT